jgi:hypothetical protein
MAQKTRLLVIIGVSDDRKARAARFDLAHEAAARKAAGLMNYRVGIPKSEQGILLASKLPEGKLFESGLGMVPLVREEVFYKLIDLLTFDQTWTTLGVISGRGTTATPELIKAADTVWSAIKVGSTVLAFDGGDPTAFGWGAAVVTGISKDGLVLDLRWRDWPGEKAFKAQKQTVALAGRPDVCP